MSTEFVSGYEALTSTVSHITANSNEDGFAFLPTGLQVGRVIRVSNTGTAQLFVHTNVGHLIAQVGPGKGGTVRITQNGPVFNAGSINRGRIQAERGLTSVANRAIFPMGTFSSGALQAVTYQTCHFSLREYRVSGLRLVFSNTLMLATGEGPGNAPITVEAAILYNGRLYQVRFNGANSITIPVDGQVISDPVGVTLPPNTQFWVRSYVSVATLGEKWPVSMNVVAGLGEGYSSTNRMSDPNFSAWVAAPLFTPTAILGYTSADIPSIAIMGSSSAVGQGDLAEGPHYDYGYLSRALSNRYGYIKVTRSSTQAKDFTTVDGARRIALFGLTKPTHVIQQLLSNDISNGNSVANIKGWLQHLWEVLDSMGIAVIQATATPITTSSDSWATEGGQTKNANNDKRVELNEWIRSCPAPLAGVLECCDAVETSRNSGLWKTDGTANKYTTDGIHLSPFAHKLVAESLDLNGLGL